MLESRTLRVARLAVLGALTATAAIAPAASAAAPATITFQAATAGSDQYTRTTIGSFEMTGPVADAGTVRMEGFDGQPIGATAVLIGTRGVISLSLRGESEARRWRVSGGTGAYRHLHGYGRWDTEVTFGANPLLPSIHGVFTGHLHRGPVPSHRPFSRWRAGHSARGAAGGSR